MPQCISVSLSRYLSLSEAHCQAFGSEEDTLLSLVLLVYMLPDARTQLGTAEERLLQQTLNHMEQNVREGEWGARVSLLE